MVGAMVTLGSWFRAHSCITEKVLTACSAGQQLSHVLCLFAMLRELTTIGFNKVKGSSPTKLSCIN